MASKTIRTIPASDYIPPRDADITRKAKSMEIPSYSTSLVQDICNLVSGGSITTQSDVAEFVRDNFKKEVKPDKDGVYRAPNIVRTKDPASAKEAWIQSEIKYHENIKEFLTTLDYSQSLLGDSPLEKALNYIKLLSASEGGEPDPGDTDSTGDKTIPIFKRDKKEVKKKAKNINESVKLVEKLKPEDKELLDIDQEKGDLENAKFLLGKDTYLEIIKASSATSKISKISTKPSATIVPDEEGDIVKSRLIRGFEEFHKVTHNELINPRNALASKIINGEATVNQRFKKTMGMPFVTMIVDNSGSMQSDNKKEKALGIIHNLITRVMKEECWLLFSFFECECHEFFFIKDRESAVNFYRKTCLTESFNTGITDVANAVKQALAKYDEVAREHPGVISPKDRHLIIINDGQDDATSLQLPMLKGAKLHGFILDESNDAIKRLAIASGGTYRESL